VLVLCASVGSPRGGAIAASGSRLRRSRRRPGPLRYQLRHGRRAGPPCRPPPVSGAGRRIGRHCAKC